MRRVVQDGVDPGHLRPVSFFTAFKHGIPLINGSDTNFSQPFVLTYPNDSFPTDKPRPQLVVTNLTGFSNGHGGPQLGTDRRQPALGRYLRDPPLGALTHTPE